MYEYMAVRQKVSLQKISITKGINYKSYRQQIVLGPQVPLRIKNIDHFLIQKVTLGWVRLTRLGGRAMQLGRLRPSAAARQAMRPSAAARQARGPGAMARQTRGVIDTFCCRYLLWQYVLQRYLLFDTFLVDTFCGDSFCSTVEDMYTRWGLNRSS